VRLQLNVRKCLCLSDACARKTFTERVPALVAPWARRTTRLATAQQRSGVDEWAHPNGQPNGTIMVDLETGEPRDVLPERSAESRSHWLKANPGIEVIGRDRADVYAAGARDGAPHAIQVADRWHLLKNCSELLLRVLHPTDGRIVTLSLAAWSAALVVHSSLAEVWIHLTRTRGVPTASRAETASEAIPGNR